MSKFINFFPPPPHTPPPYILNFLDKVWTETGQFGLEKGPWFRHVHKDETVFSAGHGLTGSFMGLVLYLHETPPVPGHETVQLALCEWQQQQAPAAALAKKTAAETPHLLTQQAFSLRPSLPHLP